MRQQTDNTGRYTRFIAVLAFFLSVVFFFVGLGVWWVESRFGSIMAAAVLGGALGIGLFVLGYWLSHRSTKSTMKTAGDLVYAASDAFRASAGAQREIAKGQAAWQVAGAQAQLTDYQADRRLEDQRVRYLVEAGIEAGIAAERAKLAAGQPQAAPAWIDVEAESGGFRFVD